MKVLLLGAALLCVSQVRGDGDLLESIFDKTMKELKGQKTEPTAVLASATSFAASTEAPPSCNAEEVVDNGSTLLKDSVDILADTFKVIYSTMYPSSGTKGCTLGTFRCFLKEFNDVQGSIRTVKTKVVNYKDKATNLAHGINSYFTHCK